MFFTLWGPILDVFSCRPVPLKMNSRIMIRDHLPACHHGYMPIQSRITAHYILPSLNIHETLDSLSYPPGMRWGEMQ
uniref:Uncharacterized protein n=1 Tax=Anguilla anguilla TaxID=7936 RepID=A0A0E9WH88_ANGAN